MGNFEGKMKWHYFLAFCWLWIVAFGQYSSFKTATSENYFKSNDPQTQHFMDELLIRNPGFKNSVITHGYICLVVCGIAIVAAIGLIMYKKFGPYAVVGLYLLNLINNAIFLGQYQKVIKTYPYAKGAGLALTSGMGLGVAFSLIFIALNIVYFIKRLHLYK